MHNYIIKRFENSDKEPNTLRSESMTNEENLQTNNDAINPSNNHASALINYSHTVNFNYGHSDNASARSTFTQTAHVNVAPFFSMRKLRLTYNQLKNSSSFEYGSFDAFKHQVLNAVAPHLELNKWQSIAARR
ncbi:hypothetical protein [Glaciecola petra]|uniref:Uncharacterized protein n=1 Tax=Glaciecola petra TaxID=3075602 RepID=A0ABU2ZNJ3_9ALTE|nr:hypothetical protein [Aestuariibacter sp. P117]MDT0594195.1 hypothetical protein [Aestuariibacter sp. P117]